MDFEEFRRHLIKSIEENESGELDDLDDLEAFVGQAVEEYNSQLTVWDRPIPDFDGMDQQVFQQLLFTPLDGLSPIRLKPMTAEQYRRIPIFNQVLWLVKRIEKEGGIKLTQAGYLPVKIVKDLYAQGFMSSYFIEKGYAKLSKEMDALPVHLARILIQLSGLVRKQHGKLMLTKSKAKVINDDRALFELILRTFTEKFQWAYFDGYGEEDFGQIGWGFTIVLLSKYGDTLRSSNFYAEKYIKAFPVPPMAFYSPYGGSPGESASRAYTLRTFVRFLDYFGVIELIEHGQGLSAKDYEIKKSELFDMVFEVGG